MKTQDSTRKEEKTAIKAQASAAMGTCDADLVQRELTDEQIAAVVGGGKMAPELIKKS